MKKMLIALIQNKRLIARALYLTAAFIEKLPPV